MPTRKRKDFPTGSQNTTSTEGRAPFRLPAARNLPYMACHLLRMLSHPPAQSKPGSWEVEVLRTAKLAALQSLRDTSHIAICVGAGVDARQETRDEDGGFANVSASHVSARLSSIVSRPRASAHLASGGRVRGTANGAPFSPGRDKRGRSR